MVNIFVIMYFRSIKIVQYFIHVDRTCNQVQLIDNLQWNRALYNCLITYNGTVAKYNCIITHNGTGALYNCLLTYN